MNKFLIINPFGIGDVLFTTPVVRALKEKYPDSFIGYWCNERVGPLLNSNTYIDKVFPLSRGDIKRVYKGINRGLKGVTVLFDLIRNIRKERFDIAFDFSLDSRYGLWSKLAGIGKRIGFDYKGRGRFLTQKINLEGYSDKHVVEYYFDLLKIADTRPGLDTAHEGITGRRGKLSLTVSKEKESQAKNMLAGYGIRPSDPVVGVAMGGGMSWGKDAIYKRWPAEKFAEVTNRLIKEKGAHIVLLGSADEKPLADSIVDLNRRWGLNPTYGSAIIDLTGKLDMEELAAMIKQLKVLICNDGGPMHMAVALGINTVSVFGPVDEKVYGPYPAGEKHVVVKKDLECRPCYRNFSFKGCFNQKKCLEGISAEEVFEKVRSLI